LIGLGTGLQTYAQLQGLRINVQLPAGVGLSSGSTSQSNSSTNAENKATTDNKDTKNNKESKDTKENKSTDGGETEKEKKYAPTQIIGDALDFTLISETGKVVPLSWIRMQSMENSQFLVDFRDKDGNQVKTQCFYLNNNTDELQQANSVSVFPALLQFNQQGRLIRNFYPRRTSLYSWIGLPNDAGLVTVLEYF
jgi:hypothetical protein